MDSSNTRREQTTLILPDGTSIKTSIAGGINTNKIIAPRFHHQQRKDDDADDYSSDSNVTSTKPAAMPPFMSGALPYSYHTDTTEYGGDDEQEQQELGKMKRAATRRCKKAGRFLKKTLSRAVERRLAVKAIGTDVSVLGRGYWQGAGLYVDARPDNKAAAGVDIDVSTQVSGRGCGQGVALCVDARPLPTGRECWVFVLFTAAMVLGVFCAAIRN